MVSEITCGDPPEVEHGHYTGPSNEYQSYMTLECDEGYEIPDTYYSRIRCRSDGSWSESSSTCEG